MKLQNPELLRSQFLIDGVWCDGRKGESLAVFNPATGIKLGTVPSVSAEQTQKAIIAAERAQGKWQQLTAKQRAAFLLAWADSIVLAKEDIAKIITAEQGKPLAEANREIDYAVSFITWFAEEAKRVDGDVLSPSVASQRWLVIKQPIGVCAAITPWNFPAAMITRKVAPALAAGCTMIVKPAEQTPLTALALTKLAQEAGIPAGVLQVITGEAEQVGKVLCASPVIRKLTFTGSTEVGRILMAQSAPTIKNLSLELGGNAPLIIFDDADLDAAVAAVMLSKFSNSGQVCICANRIYVQDGIYDRFVAKLVAEVEKLKVGDGAKKGITQGPLIDQAAVEKVQRLVHDALSKGASIATGGKASELGGNFFQPTVLRDMTQKMEMAKQEIFGPVAALFRFHDEEDVISMANDTEYGLAAYVFTQNAARQWRVPESLEYGMVGINTGIISNEVTPFGGVKQSGLGREGSHYGIDEYLEMKYLCIELGTKK